MRISSDIRTTALRAASGAAVHSSARVPHTPAGSTAESPSTAAMSTIASRSARVVGTADSVWASGTHHVEQSVDVARCDRRLGGLERQVAALGDVLAGSTPCRAGCSGC